MKGESKGSEEIQDKEGSLFGSIAAGASTFVAFSPATNPPLGQKAERKKSVSRIPFRRAVPACTDLCSAAASLPLRCRGLAVAAIKCFASLVWLGLGRLDYL